MIRKNGVAVLTICRDDQFFLQRWVAYYGALFGRSNLYIISHGDTDMVRDEGAGCNIFPVPAIETDKFTMLHWRTKNALKDALRQWYAHVIVCDVDEFVIVDPGSGHNLKTWLDGAETNTVYTALGLEPVHLRSLEKGSIDQGILGPRMHVQLAPFYAKPCILSSRCHLSRGGHYSNYKHLNLKDFLYLFHMRYCDFDLFVETLNRRNSFIEEQQSLSGSKIQTNPEWFRENRNDLEVFNSFDARPIQTGFDLAPVRDAMRKSWAPRGDDLWHFKRPDVTELFRLPDRFAGADRPILDNPEQQG